MLLGPDVQKNSPPSYVVKAGESFKVELVANSSTGYAWRIAKKEGTCDVDSIGHSYKDDFVGIPSSGGREVYEFKTHTKGTAKVILYYARPWESENPAQVKEIVVEVE